MSGICLFHLKGVLLQEELRTVLNRMSKSWKGGVCFEPYNNLTAENVIQRKEDDFIFEAIDVPVPENCIEPWKLGLALSEYCLVIPLEERLRHIYNIAKLCANYSGEVHLYISEDESYLPNYTVYHCGVEEILDILQKVYWENRYAISLPSVLFIIVGQGMVQNHCIPGGGVVCF